MDRVYQQLKDWLSEQMIVAQDRQICDFLEKDTYWIVAAAAINFNLAWVRLLLFSSSMCSNSVLLSAAETSFGTCTTLEIAQWASARIITPCICVPHVLTACTYYLIWGQRLFCLELLIIWLLFEGYYLFWACSKCGYYLGVRLLFKGSYYLGCSYYSNKYGIYVSAV